MNRGHDYTERLGPDAAGRSVLGHLARRYPHSSHEEWRSRIAEGLVLLDGRPVEPECILPERGTLVWRRPPWEEPPVPLGYAVLHRDEHLLGVAKPAGLPSVPAGGFLENTLLAQVRRRNPDATPAHRLGRGTSGVVLFAAGRGARSALAGSWRRGEVLRAYRALVEGCPGAVNVDVPIGPVPHPRLGTVHAASPGGVRAATRVRTLEERGAQSLVEVLIDTGRPHQIRIHLAAAGHPLVGDPLYRHGGLPGPALPGETGYWLHAERLGFPHPATGEWTEITCGPPPALRRVSR